MWGWWNLCLVCNAGPGGVGSPGAFTHNVRWGAPEPGAPIGRPMLAPEGGALIAASDTPPLGSRTAKRLYRKPDSVTIYKRLAAAKALVLPPEVDREDPSLFAEAGQPDVLEVLLGVHQPGTGGEPAAVHTLFPGSFSSHLASEHLYHGNDQAPTLDAGFINFKQAPILSIISKILK